MSIQWRAQDILLFCADTIMTTKEIHVEGNGIFAHVGPNIKRMNLNINIPMIVEKEVVY